MHLHTPMEELVDAALREDICQRDITTEATVPEDAWCAARLVAKQAGVLSGIIPFRMAFDLLQAELSEWTAKQDGDAVEPGDTIASFQGRTRPVLTAERTAMNFIQHLSGVATYTRRFVDALADLPCRICHTRKTTPLLRQLERDAVVHGGGAEHRYNLFHGILIKENHITAAGGVAEAIRLASGHSSHLLRIAVEVKDLKEFDEALEAGAGSILLDNMDNETMREAAARAKGRDVILEASGNASLERVRAMAETGVHRISVGALTHSAPVLDMSLLIDKC